MDFKQANLSSPASCERVFHDDEGAFDLVVNLAAETKYGQSEEVSDKGLWLRVAILLSRCKLCPSGVQGACVERGHKLCKRGGKNWSKTVH